MVSATSGRSTPGASSSSRRDSVGSNPPNTTSVKVVVRVRPNSGADAAKVSARFQRIVVQPVSSTTLQVESAPPGGTTSASAVAALAKTGGKTTFTFDRVIGPEEGQPAVYECATPLVDSFIEGMNVTILAYGQTSSGKSYTMGTDRTSEADDALGEERLGITPRAVAEIFERMRDVTKETKGGTTFTAKLSYIEIYNEDLIDLLAGDVDVRPTVQIREDKSGNIIWSGLREVKVSSAAEVMDHLTTGSALRQTSSTDMNSQSSRSHAIFSLTLTQRKYTGTGTPPAPPSPTNSRLANRTSMLPRVTSPTPGSRSGTPTGDRPNSRFGLRPPSQIGRPTSPQPSEEGTTTNGNGTTGTESWATITSKFHFVDLAGSERLKRTAAQGDRAKEGISINSGLSALGNVISALGDPTKKMTHIPYRDSKLTRLLQDSLGGNSHTMMVACVSPTEFNLSETLSTVKYANRARNIKNRAEINEVEVGWDDVEYLQRTITKLRGELGALKGGDGVNAMRSIAEEGPGGRRSFEGGPDQEMMDKYNDMQQRLTQVTTELAVAQAGAAALSSSSLSREDFARAVEPVVEEYEKSISALESQLSLTRAALSHSEDEMHELEQRVEEEVRTNDGHMIVIDELKSRVTKLAEREATTEAYVRDLEAKLKDYDDQDESHGTAVSDLRKEITRNREQGETTERYINELEGRLAKSDEFSAALKRQIEVLERDIERRESAYHELESRLSLLDTSGEHKLLLAEIDEKDRRVLDLERSLDELKNKAAATEQDADRLGKLAQSEKEAKEELQSRVRTLERQSAVPAAAAAAVAARSNEEGDSEAVSSLASQLTDLKKNHEDTLVLLETANARYQASLKEIEDLNSQVLEAKTGQSDGGYSIPPSPSVGRRGGFLDGDEEVEELASPTSPDPSSSPTSGRTPRQRRSMPLAPQHRLSFLGRGQTTPAHTHVRSPSLSQELSLAVSSQSSSPPSPRPSSPSPSSPNNRESIYGSLMASSNDRSYEQMKGEVMKLQTALNEREAEIAELESNLLQLRGAPPGSPVAPKIVTSGFTTPPRVGSPALEDDPSSVVHLSPKTRAAFDAVKEGSPSEEPNRLRLNDLMLAMAKKESVHRETVEQLEEQLSTLKRQHDELTVLSRDQVVNMSSEISRLRSDLEGRPEQSHWDEKLKTMQTDLESKSAEVESSRAQAETDLASAKSTLAEEHQRGLDSLVSEHSTALLRLGEEHAETLKCSIAERDELLRQKEEEHASAVRSLSTSHDEAFALRTAEHDSALQAKSDESEAALKRKADELDEATKRFEIERTALADSGKESSTALVEQLNSEHATVLQKREEDFNLAMDKLKTRLEAENAAALAALVASHSTALSSKAEEFESRDRDLKSAHQTELEGLRSERESALTSKTEEHETALASTRDQHASELEQKISTVKEEHSLALDELIKGHQTSLDSLATKHAADLEATRAVHEDDLTTKITTLVEEHTAAQSALATEHSTAIEELKASHAQVLADEQASHAKALEELTNGHQEQLKSVEAERDTAALSHRDLLVLHEALGTDHSTTREALSTAETEREDVRQQLQALSEKHDLLSADHAKEVASLQEQVGAGDQDRTKLQESLDALSTMEKALQESQTERERLVEEVGTLSTSDEDNKGKLETVSKDLEQLRTSVTKLEGDLAQARQERDGLAGQLARFSVGQQSNASSNGVISSPDPNGATSFDSPSMTPDRAMSPSAEAMGRSSPSGRHDSRLLNGLTNGKPPPPTPPPSMPPPPLPTTLPPLPNPRDAVRGMTRSSSSSSIGRNSISGGTDTTAGTSVRADSTSIDPRVAKKFEEQEAQIARLTKQLTHCESDLQANIDLVNTLESALNDSERNLRKARTQMNDLAKERDTLLSQNEALRVDLTDAHTENETFKESVLDMENRAQNERYKQEQAKRDFARQMEEANKSKQRNKFQCF